MGRPQTPGISVTVLTSLVLVLGTTSTGIVWAQEAETPIRSQAVVDLTFDGNPVGSDQAKAGTAPDQATLQGNATVVSSPFWNQSGRQAVQLDAAKQQFVEIADSADVDRPDAATVALLTLHLHDASDATFHGLFAKRGQENGKMVTNYGINFGLQNDTFQVYLNDGMGFRVAQYSTSAVFPTRRRTFLAVTYQVADAPGADADADLDDVRMQLFVNGKPVMPKGMAGGFVDGYDCWATDVQIAGLVNNLPVTIGRSEAAGEYFSGVVDEFLLFPTALTADQVGQLFQEVAGRGIQEQLAADQQPLRAAPEIARLSQPGLTLGQETRIAIVGKHLLPHPRVMILGTPIVGEIVGEPQADRLNVRLQIPAEAQAGYFPLVVQTDHGSSDFEPVAIDSLRNIPAGSVKPEESVPLPVAVNGQLAGGQEIVVPFEGQRGQRILADVELKRLGGKAAPVLELRASNGAPLAIAWGQSQHQGDARIEFTLPADGKYSVALHDLVYRAPGPNAFRLKLGELSLADRVFPPVATTGLTEVEPIGPGWREGAKWAAQVQPTLDEELAVAVPPSSSSLAGPWPQLRRTTGADVVESLGAAGEATNLPDLLVTSGHQSVAVSGRWQTAHERDTFLVPVKPGTAYIATLETPSLHSACVGEVEVLSHPQGQRLAISGEQTSESDPQVTFNVPADVSTVRCVTRRLYGPFGREAIYRLVLKPASLNDFSLQTLTPILSLPSDGTALVELDVKRQGYAGPITLSVRGSAGIAVDPPQIAANVAGKVLVRLRRNATNEGDISPWLKLVGTTQGVEPEVSREAVRKSSVMLSGFARVTPVGITPPAGYDIRVENPPTVLFKGAPTPITVSIARTTPAAPNHILQFSLQTTEPVRERQPNNPAAGKFPVVEITPGAPVTAESSSATVTITTPLESVEPAIDVAIVGEQLPHLYSQQLLQRAYAVPLRVSLQTAIKSAFDAPSLAVVAETQHQITGKLNRTAGFAAPVEVSLSGLPAGYQSTPVTVPGDQDNFQIVVTAPAVTAETGVPNVKLRATTSGSLLQTDQDVPLKVIPKPAN